MAEDRLVLNVIKTTDGFDPTSCQSMDSVGASELGPYLATALGSDLPISESAMVLSATLLGVLGEFSTDDELTQQLESRDMARAIPRMLFLLHPVLEATGEVGEYIDESLKQREAGAAEQMPPITRDDVYMVSLYDLACLAAAIETNTSHALFQNTKLLESARRLVKPGQSLEVPGNIGSQLGLDELLQTTGSEFSDDVTQDGVLCVETIRSVCGRSVEFRERMSALYARWQEGRVPMYGQLVAELETALGGKLTEQWSAFYEFLLYGPRDGVFEQQFISPDKSRAKTITKTLRVIDGFVKEGASSGISPQESIYSILEREHVVVSLGRQLSAFIKKGDAPLYQPVIGEAIDWLTVNANDLRQSGLMMALTPAFRATLKDVLALVEQEQKSPDLHRDSSFSRR